MKIEFTGEKITVSELKARDVFWHNDEIYMMLSKVDERLMSIYFTEYIAVSLTMGIVRAFEKHTFVYKYPNANLVLNN